MHNDRMFEFAIDDVRMEYTSIRVISNYEVCVYKILYLYSAIGIQPRAPHRAGEPRADLPVRDAQHGGGAHPAGGSTQDDAHASGGAAGHGRWRGGDEQEGARRHPQVRH